MIVSVPEMTLKVRHSTLNAGSKAGASAGTREIGARAGAWFGSGLLALALLGCTARSRWTKTPLPPTAELEQGCHVWWANMDLDGDGETDEDDGEPRKGFYATLNVDGRATLYMNGDGEDGGVLQPSGKVVRGEHEIAHFDGRFVIIAKHDPEDPIASEFSADLSVPAPNVLVFRNRARAVGQDPAYTLRRSAGCTLEQTALGVSSLVFAMMESRAEAIAIGSQWLSR